MEYISKKVAAYGQFVLVKVHILFRSLVKYFLERENKLMSVEAKKIFNISQCPCSPYPILNFYF